MATIKTDKHDYAPASTAIFTAFGYDVGATIRFLVQHTINPGLDGIHGTLDDVLGNNSGQGHTPWHVTDGGLGDLDGIANGSIVTSWYVNPDDSLNERFLLTGTEIKAGNDGLFGTIDDQIGATATTTFTDSAPPLVQTYYIPLREGHLYNSFDLITTDPVSFTIESLTVLAVAVSNTVIHYDHWEDGYGNNVQIWGDGNLANGSAPGDADDLLVAGQLLRLQNTVTTPRPFTTPAGTLFFDGSDKIQSTLPIAVTRGAWPTTPGSLMAGGVEVFDTSRWGTTFHVPVGNTVTGDATAAFESVQLAVMAGANNTRLTLRDKAGVAQTIPGGGLLNEGQEILLTVNQGWTLTSNKDVQVNMLYGDIGSTYELRWSALTPLQAWTNDYYTPVGTAAVSLGGSTVVWLYNPNTFSITVNVTTLSGPQPAITLLAGQTLKSAAIPDGSGARFHTTNPAHVFFAISQTDASGTGGGQIFDWDTILLPSSQLQSDILVGWGDGTTTGTTTPFPGSPVVSRSVVWVTPVSNAFINIDFDNNGTIDNSVSVNARASLKIADETVLFSGAQNDRNMSGAYIFASTGINGTGTAVKIAAAWGQNPAYSGSGDGQGLDLGTLVLPVAVPGIVKSVDRVTNPGGSLDSDGIVDQAGDVIHYNVTVFNTSTVTQTNVVVTDPLLGGTLGTIASLPRGASQTFTGTYTVTAADISSNGTAETGNIQAGYIDNTARVTSTQNPVPNTATAKVAIQEGSLISGTVRADLNNDGIGDIGLVGITISLFADANQDGVADNATILATTTTNASGFYSMDGISPGHYVVVEIDSAAYPIDVSDSDGNTNGTNLDRIRVSLSTGTNSTGNDFVDRGVRTISGNVRADTNNDNTGDLNLAGVTLTLRSADGSTVLATTTTDASGNYSFTVAPGVYQVVQTNLPAHPLDVSDTEGANDNTINNINVNAGDSTGNNFVDEPRRTISGNVSADTNNNDLGDTNLAGVTVTLRTTDGSSVLATTTTDTNGNYSFSVAPGVYQVVQTNLATHPLDVSDTQGANDNTINNINVNAGDSTGNNFVDEANEPQRTISGNVSADTNNNDLGDTNLAGVTVTLRTADGSSVLATTTTDASGNYSFTVAPGVYQVVQTNLATHPLDVSDTQGANDNTINNINVNAGDSTGNNFVDEAAASIGDRVWFDRNLNGMQDANEIGVGNVTIRLTDQSGAVLSTTTSDANGVYRFNNVAPGTYSLEFDKSATVFRGINFGTSRFHWSLKDQGGADDTRDSDVNSTTDNRTRTDLFTVTGVDNLNQDAGITPIIIDLNGDGILTLARNAAQGRFDLLGTGTAIKSGWISTGDAFLVMDGNGNGQIDSIHEMFGGLAKGAGFAKLATYDSNNDGFVDQNDDHFADLQVWRDANSNHQTDPGELLSLSELGLARLSVDYIEQPQLDAQGNLHLERSHAAFADGRTVAMTDVYFNVATADAQAAGIELPSLADLLGDADTAVTLTGGNGVPIQTTAVTWL